MSGVSKVARRKLIMQATNLMVKGMSDRDVVQWVQDQGRSRSAAYDIIAHCNKILARRAETARPQMIARQSAKLEKAQQQAMGTQKAWVNWGKDGQPTVHKENAPDLSSFISAVTAQNRLLGLNAPEQKEVIFANVQDLLRDVATLLMEFVQDPKQRKAMLDALQKRAQVRMSQKRVSDGPIVEAEAQVIDAPTKGPQLPPGRNGHG